MVEGSSADFAKRIEMAFENDGWPGTDEEALRDVIRQIPPSRRWTRSPVPMSSSTASR